MKDEHVSKPEDQQEAAPTVQRERRAAWTQADAAEREGEKVRT